MTSVSLRLHLPTPCQTHQQHQHQEAQHPSFSEIDAGVKCQIYQPNSPV